MRFVRIITHLSFPISLVLLTTGWLLAADQAPHKPRNVILIGWDGAQREHVMECLERGELPNLKAIIQQGSFRQIEVRGTTDTKAGWSQILTGYDPDVTGVYSNRKFQPVPEGLSVFERLKQQFGQSEFVTAAVIGKKQHCGEIRPPSKMEVTEASLTRAQTQQNQARQASRAAAQAGKNQPNAARRGAATNPRQPLRDNPDFVPGQGKTDVGTRIVEENGRKYKVFPGSPYYFMKDGCDQWLYGLMKDQAVGTKALELLDHYQAKPFFLFVHFAEVDHNGHRFGENSKQYTDALISNDRWTGRILEKLRQLGLDNQTLVYVTADHGFNEAAKGHRRAPHVFLATNDPRVGRDGDRADITPTILDRFGLDLATLRPPLAGHSLLRQP